MSGRAVLVTGGAAGIGLATARRFACAGDRVAVADLNGEAATARAAELGEGCIGLRADVADEADVRAMVAAAVARFGRLDVLVNNAGVIDARATPMVEQSAADVRALLAVNLTGAWAAAREAGRVMLGQGGGVVVNLVSGAGSVAVPLRNAYGASKAALTQVTRHLAAEWARGGVRVNAVSPGYTRTELVQRLVDGGKVDLRSVAARIPLGRLAEPAEIAEAVFHFAGEDAAGVTGAVLDVDGGYLAFGGTGAASTTVAPAGRGPASRRVLVVGTDAVAAAVARRLSSRGDRVAVLGGDQGAADALAASLPGEGHAICGDVRDEPLVDRLVDGIASRWGGLDVLVNVAAVAQAGAGPDDRAAFEQALDGQLTASFIVAKAAARSMLRGRGGAIVNRVDAAAGSAGWAAAAGGLVMLTRACACEWAAGGVRVTAVATGRDAWAHDAVGPIAFLASDAASYVTGAMLRIDGGVSASGVVD